MLLRGCWDYPSGSNLLGRPVARNGLLPLVGWVTGEAPTIDIKIDGKIDSTIRPQARREDIEIIFHSELGDSPPHTGWAYGVNTDKFDETAHDVEVVVRDRRGKQVVLGSRTLDFSRPKPLSNLSNLLEGSPTMREGRAYFGEPQGDWRSNATSTFGFSGWAQTVMKSGGDILVVGAGVSPVFEGVVQLDIFDFPNIDVISSSDSLPFKSAAFDAVLCENVIEHVPDPFRLTAEIMRVAKVGAKIGINGTNLHFTHGALFLGANGLSAAGRFDARRSFIFSQCPRRQRSGQT